MKKSLFPISGYALGFLLTVAMCFPAASWAAMDMFLKIPDIPGESKDAVHADDHDILAYSFGMSNSGSAIYSGGGAGKANFQDLSVTKWLNKGSPKLLLYCANGQHIQEVILTVRKAGETPVEYWKIKLTDVIITSVTSGGSGGEDRLTENVTFNYGRIEWSYTPVDDKGGTGGSIDHGWDLESNKGI